MPAGRAGGSRGLPAGGWGCVGKGEASSRSRKLQMSNRTWNQRPENCFIKGHGQGILTTRHLETRFNRCQVYRSFRSKRGGSHHTSRPWPGDGRFSKERRQQPPFFSLRFASSLLSIRRAASRLRAGSWPTTKMRRISGRRWMNRTASSREPSGSRASQGSTATLG